MQSICSWCKKDLGPREPLDNPAITHGICPDCQQEQIREIEAYQHKQQETTAMYERFTDRARKVLQLANQEAQRLNHEYIGTEHVLMGLLKEGSGVAANVLKNLDISLYKAEELIKRIVQPGPDEVTMGKLPQTPRCKKVIEYAIEEARTMGLNYLGTEHLLLGLLREKEGIAAQVLVECGSNLDAVRDEVLLLIGKAEPKDAKAKQRLNDHYGAVVARIKELCGEADPKDAFERILTAIKVFQESEPPAAPDLTI
jgi:ATP-dependent Clp protease ATP-binding subunit ClpA